MELGSITIEYAYAFGREGENAGEFSFPVDVTVLPDQTLLVVESEDNWRVQRLTVDGVPLNMWGKRGDDCGCFSFPFGIAHDTKSNVYIADAGNNRIQKFTPDGRFISCWGTHGTALGEMIDPEGIAVVNDIVFVADTGNKRLQVFDTYGQINEAYTQDMARHSGLAWPRAIAGDQQGNIYVVDYVKSLVVKYNRRRERVCSWGGFGGYLGELNYPRGIAVDQCGRVIVSDTRNSRIQVFLDDGTWVTCWNSDSGCGAELYEPSGIAVYQDTLYVADTQNHCIKVFRVSGK
jgi:tripartite motif-containing protein 71